MRVPCTRVEARGQPLAFPQVPSTRAAFETGPLTGLHSGLCSLASELPHRLPLPSQHPQLYFFFFKPRLKLKFSRLQRSMVTAVSLDLPLLGSLHPPQTPVHRCVPPPPACSASWLPFLPLPGGAWSCKDPVPNQSRAHLAAERLLPRVLQRVHLERHAALEGLPAGLAGEGHVLGVGCGRVGAIRHLSRHLPRPPPPDLPSEGPVPHTGLNGTPKRRPQPWAQ